MLGEVLEIKEFGNCKVGLINGGHSSNYLLIEQTQSIRKDIVTIMITIDNFLTIADWADKANSQYS